MACNPNQSIPDTVVSLARASRRCAAEGRTFQVRYTDTVNTLLGRLGFPVRFHLLACVPLTPVHGLRPIARLRRVYTALPFPTHCRVSSDMATRVPLLLAFAILTCFPQAFAALPKNLDAKTAKLLSNKYAVTPIFACCQPSSCCLLACVYSMLSGKAPEV